MQIAFYLGNFQFEFSEEEEEVEMLLDNYLQRCQYTHTSVLLQKKIHMKEDA